MPAIVACEEIAGGGIVAIVAPTERPWRAKRTNAVIAITTSPPVATF